MPDNESHTVLHITTRLVLVDVHVSGPDGTPVQGLSKDIFEVKENEIRQSIAGFDEHSPKIDQTGLPPLDFDLPTHNFVNLKPTSSTGPLCVILFDQLNTPLDSQMFAHGEILRFLRNKGAGTQVAIFTLGDRLAMLQGFTSDTRRLIAAMNSPTGKPKLTALGGDSYLSTDPAAVARRVNAAQQTLDAFADIGQFLAAAPGRKNLLWFSQSFQALQLPATSDADDTGTAQQQTDGATSYSQKKPSEPDSSAITNGANDYGRMSESTVNYEVLAAQVRKVSTELAVSQTAVYPIDVRGMFADPAFSAGGSPTSLTSQRQRPGATPGMPNANGGTPVFVKNSNDWNQSLDATQATMREIAQATGGEAYINTNNLARAAARAVDEGSYYYTLAYSPTNAKFDGNLRNIHISLVKLDSGQSYRLSYRRAYYADNPDVVAPVSARRDALEAALVDGAPDAQSILFKVRIDPDGLEKPAPQASPQAATGADAPRAPSKKESAKGASARVPEKIQTYNLRFAILARQMTFTSTADGHYHGALDIAVAAYAADGRRLGGSKQHLEAAIPSPLIDKTSDEGFYHRMSVDVPTDAARLRIVVRDPASGRVGSVEIVLPL